MKKVLFIDRDGTLVIEPPVDYQLDSLEKLEFYPKVMRNLGFVRSKLDFEFVMVTNQDGLGTASFPEETFWPAHNLMMKTLEGEGVTFDDICIDRSMPEDNAPTRKPRTGMLTKYLGNPDYDLVNSFVIGDRTTDVELAKNLGCRAIFLQEDTGIVLGQAIRKAVGDKKGIMRYGSQILPMDESLVLCALDLCGRPYLVCDLVLDREKVGDLETEMVREFFYAVSYGAEMNLHLKQLSGTNNHHIIEAAFKAFAKALDGAVAAEPRLSGVLSTKGSL